MPTTALTLRQLVERDERVFPSYPQVARYFPGRLVDEARARLGRAIERGDGPGLIIGGPGTGKSLLLQVLAAHFHEQFDVVLPACARLCTRRALLQAILFELGLSYRSRDEGELRLGLLDHLLSREECPSGLLLLVDEAQTLPVALLDELRVLTNLVRGAAPRVRLVLAGSSTLEESFTDPELESFSQRLSARCYLGPFSREETTQFIRAQLVASRATPDEVFSADAWQAVFEATDGVPRLVNQLCDHALTDAVAAGRKQIDGQIIRDAWSGIQQLPTLWDRPETTADPQPSHVVEFGDLAGDNSNRAPISVPNDDEYQFEPVISTKLTDFDTELDIEDEPTQERAATTLRSDVAGKTSKPLKVSADPFAEKFDEEEVVLDNFAAWDDMFRRDLPRVSNRRDPEFATLVEVAMRAAPVNDIDERCRAADLSFEFDLQSIVDVAGETDGEQDEPALDADTTWPPLRIADLSDVLLPPFPIDEVDDDPVLIIEDDAAVLATPKPPVRREQYRHLFSRLRSG